MHNWAVVFLVADLKVVDGDGDSQRKYRTKEAVGL